MSMYTISNFKKLICFGLVLFCIKGNAQKLISYAELGDEDGFMPNEGQVTDANYVYNDEVAFVNFGKDMNIQLRKSGFSYERFVVIGKKDTTRHSYDFMFPNKRKYIDEKVIYHRIDVELIGMNPDYKIEQTGMSPDYMHYVLGERGHETTKNIHRYNKVFYRNIYNNIDLEFVVLDGKFKFNWVLHPGANISDIKLKYNNANELKLTNGNLQIKTNLGILEESLPSSYIVSLGATKGNDNNSNQVKVVYNINVNIISYTCNAYTNIQTLIIDPVVEYKWGTYIASFADSATTYVSNVNQYFGGGDCDKAGNSYFVGTSDGRYGYVSQGKPWDTSVYLNNTMIVKFNPYGQRIWGMKWGDHRSNMYRVRTDDSCNIWISGTTYSSKFIATKGAYIDSIYNQAKNHIQAGFISHLDSSGNLLIGTYLSNNKYTGAYATDFDFDSDKNIIIAGYTDNDTSMGTLGTHQPKKSGFFEDAFIIKLSPKMQRIWGTYYGGNYALGTDIADGLAVDKYNNIYITGYTSNDSGITTPDCYKCSRAQYYDGEGFFAKFSTDGKLLYGSFYGTKTGNDGMTRTMIDDNNNWVIVGTIDGPGMCTPGVFDTINQNGLGTPHIAVFDSLMHRKYACNIAGGGGVWDIRLKDGDYYMAGEAYAAYPGRKFTTSASPFEKGSGWSDGYIVRISPDLETVRWGTVAGGRSAEVFNQIGFNGKDIYAFGTTGSSNRIGSSGTFMPNHPDTSQGIIIGFMMRFTDCSPALMVSGPQNICEGDTITLNATGAQSYLWSPSNSTQSSIIAHPTQNTIYSVTGTDTGVCSITKNIKVNVGKKPSLSLQLLGKSAFCLGDSVGIKAHYNDSTNIKWTFNSQPLYDNQDSVRYAKASGIYSVSASTLPICVVKIDQQIWASAPPKPVISIVGDSLVSTPFSTYQWYVDGVQIPNGNTKAIKPAKSGDYIVVVTDSIGCKNQSDLNYKMGIEEANLENYIYVYPNPSHAGNDIVVKTESNKIQSIIIFDQMGREIKGYLSGNSGIYKLSNLATGIYIIQVRDGNGDCYNKKIVIY